MKKLLPIILLTSLFLSACSIDWNNKDDLFSKKEHCAKMKNEIQDEQTQGIYVREVFYSKKMDSCLYVLDGKTAKFIIDRFGDELKGLYNSDSESFCHINFGNESNEVEKNALKECLTKSYEFDQKLKELKGE